MKQLSRIAPYCDTISPIAECVGSLSHIVRGAVRRNRHEPRSTLKDVRVR
jgi:hypothetical protein